MRRLVPGPSQNRTWSVTPSGSQPESFTVEQGSNPAPCRLRIDGTRRSAGLCAHRPEGGARQLRETRERRCHGQSPHGVGPCFTLALSRAATPLLDPRYRASTLVWMAPTSTQRRPRPRFSLVRGCPPPADRCVDLPGYRMLSMSGSIRPRTPGSTRIARHTAMRIVACRGAKPVGTPDAKIFGAQHLQGRHHPLPLHLACFRAYASTRPLPATPQGSILGSRRTITQAGVPPARTRGLARPHWPCFLLSRAPRPV